MFLESEKLIGSHRLSEDHLGRPGEFHRLQRYMRRYGNPNHLEIVKTKYDEKILMPVYKGLEAWEEMLNCYPEVQPRYPIVQWEISPTWECPEDCGGCPDRASLHINDPPETRLDFDGWKERVNFAVARGGKYLLLIGGTIDKLPVARQTMRYILDETPADAGWFTDGIILTDWRTGKPNVMLDTWILEAKILRATTHVSADYLNLPDTDRSLPSPKVRWENSRWFKSAYGLNLAQWLANRGAKRVIINTAVSAHNVKEVIPIYEHVKQLQDDTRKKDGNTVVLWTLSPWQHYTHLIFGDDPRNYDSETVLTSEHHDQIRAIAGYVLDDTFDRIKQGLPRVAANSSGYLSNLADKGIGQSQTFFGIMPGVGAFTPDGTFMPDPMAQSALQLKRPELFRTSYGYTDRVPVGEGNVWTQQEDLNVGTGFPNLVQSTKPNVGYQWK